MAEAAGGDPQLPEEIVLWEILTRLPSKPLLRCRAVCRSWRRLLTSDGAFLLAHHRRQPAFQLVTIGGGREIRIDALDHRSGERRPVAQTGRVASQGDLHPLAVCDGLLIVSAYRTHHICNPATRQRAPLPLLRGFKISGLYLHCLSGSYRVLCWNRTRFPNDCMNLHGGRIVYYVHTVGSSELRRVGEPPEQWSWKVSFKMPVVDYCYPHALVQGRFYWRPIELPSTGSRKPNNMLVFDTVAESFRVARTPVEGPCADPCELKRELGLYCYNGHSAADLWVMEDYENNIWSFKYRIKLELPMFSLVPDSEDVFVISRKKGCDVGISKCLKHLSASGVATQHEWSTLLWLTRHRFKESLVRHNFFPEEGNVGVDETPLFHGLSTAVVLPD